jgi:preprotein translocase subunit SecF
VSLASRLYHGETSYDFVGRRRLWFAISGAVMLVSLVSLFAPGLNFGIDFKGGAVFRAAPGRTVTEAQVRDAVGASVAKVVQVTSDQPPQVIVQTEALPQDEVARVRANLARVSGVQPNQVSTDSIGSKWGSAVSRKALLALVVFLVVVTVYVSFRMEWKMAVAAIVALLHDLLITAGVYALARFEVTPATVIALLTILGYSLYDTVVVFDKVRENTGSLTSMSRTTYADAANLAVNQTVMRSLNTSLASLFPIGALLFVGAFLLGAETLKDLALALFIGVTAGTYSSIFIATPLTAWWKEQEPRYRQLRARVERLAAPAGPPPPPPGRGRRRASRPAAAARRPRPPSRTSPRRSRRRPARRTSRPRSPRRPGARPRSPVEASSGASRPGASRRARPSAAAAREESACPEISSACAPWSATCPTSPSPASSSRTSPRCSPTRWRSRR